MFEQLTLNELTSILKLTAGTLEPTPEEKTEQVLICYIAEPTPTAKFVLCYSAESTRLQCRADSYSKISSVL